MKENKTTISYQPTDGLSYDPDERKYWDATALAKEIERTFEICHGCRMCFKYCDSFPTLFDLIDHEHDGDVRKLDAAETDRVMGACFQCKLCEVQCPYTERDGHEFRLDFPRLVHRYRAQKRRTERPSLRDRLLSNPDLAGTMARASFGAVNALNRSQLHRRFMERYLGIHREKLLPEFASSTFERWAASQGRISREPGDPPPEAVLFQTCYVQNHEPQIGRDTLEVLNRSQVSTACIAGFQCCGMPAWETGDLESTRSQARHNLKLLKPFVDAGARVLAINPTCAMMMRREYPDLVASEDHDLARSVADAVQDPSEYLWSLRKEERFDTGFKSSPGPRVAYHAPCHLRAQAAGFKGRDLLKKIPGVELRTTMDCCGHDGTHAMKVEGFEYSKRVGGKAFDEMKGQDAEVWATDCPLAALQFQQHAGVKPMHPMSILARAYREDGFSNELESSEVEGRDR